MLAWSLFSNVNYITITIDAAIKYRNLRYTIDILKPSADLGIRYLSGFQQNSALNLQI